MKINNIVFIVMSMLITIGFSACSKDAEEDYVIYGTAIGSKTGLPLPKVEISTDKELGASTVTGHDGTYELTLPGGRYYGYITITATAYWYSPNSYNRDQVSRKQKTVYLSTSGPYKLQVDFLVEEYYQ